MYICRACCLKRFILKKNNAMENEKKGEKKIHCEFQRAMPGLLMIRSLNKNPFFGNL